MRKGLRFVAALAVPSILLSVGFTQVVASADSGQINEIGDVNDFHNDARYSTYYNQKIEWGPDCVQAKDMTFECAQVLAPMDWHNPDKGSIKITISRILIDGKPVINSRLLLTNPGGPGGNGLGLSSLMINALGLQSTHTPIDIQPRGTGSDGLDCAPVPATGMAGEDGDSRFPSRKESQAASAAVRLSAAECIKKFPDRVSTISTDQIARDFNLVRAVMGFKQADYLGFSYGTMLGTYLKKAFPQSFDRVVLDANMNTFDTYDAAWANLARGFQQAQDRVFFPWIARMNSDFKLGADAYEVKATYERLRQAIKAGKVANFTADRFDMAIGSLAGNPASMQWAAVIFLVAKIAVDGGELPEKGIHNSADAQAMLTRFAQENPSKDTMGMGHYAVVCNDMNSKPDDQVHADMEQILRLMPAFAAMGTGSKCSQWPFPSTLNKEIMARPMKALMAQTEIDPNTPYWGARYARVNTEGDTKMVFVDNGLGHGAIQHSCAQAAERNYLRDGIFPSRDQHCQADPLPGNTTTFEYERAATDDRPLPFNTPYFQRNLSMPVAVPGTQALQEGGADPAIIAAIVEKINGPLPILR